MPFNPNVLLSPLDGSDVVAEGGEFRLSDEQADAFARSGLRRQAEGRRKVLRSIRAFRAFRYLVGPTDEPTEPSGTT